MKRHLSLLTIILFVFLLACSNDEPKGSDTQDKNNIPDPEETVTVSLYKNTNVDIDGINIDASDNFTSKNGWVFTSLGEMNGLGNITMIPWGPWSSNVKVKRGWGYIAYNAHDNVFYRLFISNSASDEMGTITGYQVKYQKPFYGADENACFNVSEFSVPYFGGTFSALFTNKSLIPVTVESDCDWIKLNNINYGLFIDTDRSINFTVSSTKALTPSVGHITVTTYNGSKTVITINREALIPWEATTSIYNLKNTYWKSTPDYTTLINQSTIIRGKVVSSDEAGNVYKFFCIDDGSSAIKICVNSYNLYQIIPQGQEIAINLKNLFIGKYYGLIQIGYESYNSQNETSITFAPYDALDLQIIGEPSAVSATPTNIPTLINALNNNDELIKWQSRYVKLSDIEFNEQNVPLASYHENKILLIHDASKLQLEIKTSGYCNFYNERTPKGIGEVSGILSYYDGKWQLILNSLSDLGNFDSTQTHGK